MCFSRDNFLLAKMTFDEERRRGVGKGTSGSRRDDTAGEDCVGLGKLSNAGKSFYAARNTFPKPV